MVKVVAAIANSCKPNIYHVIGPWNKANWSCKQTETRKSWDAVWMVEEKQIWKMVKWIVPANRKTKPRDPFSGFAMEKMPIVTSPMPMMSSSTAANTVRQFSRIFGWFQQCVYKSVGGTLIYSCINESLSLEVVSSAPNLLFLHELWTNN